jgi:hypothetical protein
MTHKTPPGLVRKKEEPMGFAYIFFPSVTESSNNNQFTGPRENTNIRA